jgi:hypothetical protein
MALSLRDVRCDPIASRALAELMHDYTVAEEESRLVLTKKSGTLQLFLQALDDLHQWDFIQHREMLNEREGLRARSVTLEQQRESWKVRALMAEAQLLEATAKAGGEIRPRNVSDVRYVRSSAFWRSASTPITPARKGSRRSSATRSSRKFGARSSASIRQARRRAPRRRAHPPQRDRTLAAARALMLRSIAARAGTMRPQAAALRCVSKQ